jgi:hypothetical protein
LILNLLYLHRFNVPFMPPKLVVATTEVHAGTLL